MTHSKRYMILFALTVALGGFVWGFDATVISGAVPFIQKYFQLTGVRGDFLLGLAVSCLGWGVLAGTAVAGFFSDRFGRKKVLITTAVFFTVSALASALTTNFSLRFVRHRFVAAGHFNLFIIVILFALLAAVAFSPLLSHPTVVRSIERSSK